MNAFYLRGEMLIWVLLSLMPLFAMLLIWPAVYQSPSQSFDFSLSHILTYYLIGHFVSNIVINHFDTWMVDRVRQGDIARDFLQPISPGIRVILIEAGWRIVRTILFSVPLAVILAFMYKSSLMWPSTTAIFFMIPFLVVGFIISGLINLLVVTAAFKLEHANSLIHLRWALEVIFTGSMVPLELLPNPLQLIATWLPFRFLYYIPSQLYLNRYTNTQSLMYLLMALLWIVFLTLLVKNLWNYVLKSYSAVGN